MKRGADHVGHALTAQTVIVHPSQSVEPVTGKSSSRMGQIDFGDGLDGAGSQGAGYGAAKFAQFRPNGARPAKRPFVRTASAIAPIGSSVEGYKNAFRACNKGGFKTVTRTRCAIAGRARNGEMLEDS